VNASDTRRDSIATKASEAQPVFAAPVQPSKANPAAVKRHETRLQHTHDIPRSVLKTVQGEFAHPKPERSIYAVGESSKAAGRRFAAKVERDPNRRKSYPALQPITVGEGLSNSRDPAALNFQHDTSRR
jgi:hypothetical protein